MPSEAFPKRERIASRREFVRIYEEGRKIFSRYSVLFIAPNRLEYPRLGVTVTRKIGKAHQRNRLKRWVRETYRRGRAAVGLEKRPLDLVVNVKTAAAGAEYKEFAEDLMKVFRRAADSSAS